MSTKNTFTIVDYSAEKSNLGLTSITVNAGNLAAQQTAAAALAGAIDDLTIGELVKQVQSLVILDDYSVPSSPYAQRELKWLVSYQGVDSGKIFQCEIACPDITDNVLANTDIADLSSDDWDAFVTAFVSYVRSPDNGTENVIVVGAKLVGRNI